MQPSRDMDYPMEAILEPRNPSRDHVDLDRLQALADDIAANGLHQRIGLLLTGDADAAEIIFGHRRFLAHRLLNRATIPATVYPAGTDVLLVRMAENHQREDLTPIEEARLCRDFAERGDPVLMIARHFRRSEAWVHSRLDLLELPADLRDAIGRREIVLGVARELARIDHAPTRAEFLGEAVRNGATEKTVAVWAAQYLADAARFKANTITVAEIQARRNEFVLMARCDACEGTHELAATVQVRFCHPCLEIIQRAIASVPEKAPTNA